jgi:hypothetical protein
MSQHTAGYQEPQYLFIPDTPPNPLLKIRVLRPAWCDLVRALASHERRLVLHIQSARDRGALYHAIIRHNNRVANTDGKQSKHTKLVASVGTLRLNSLALEPAGPARKGEEAVVGLNWLVTVVRRGITEEENLLTYEAMGKLGAELGTVSPRHHYLPHMLAALNGGFIPVPRLEGWKGQRTQMRKFIKKRAAAAGFSLEQAGEGAAAWVGSTEDEDHKTMLLSFSVFARQVWVKIKDQPALNDRDDDDESSDEDPDDED